MKHRLFIITAAIMALASTAVQAKEQGDEFNGYWFLNLKGGAGYTVGEDSFKNLITPAAALGFGYQFTPVWSLRGDFSGWAAKGAVNTPYHSYKFNYVQATADVMVDICNIFAPYKVKRTLNPYLLAGLGANYRFNNNEAAPVADRFEAGYYWDSPKVSLAGRVGVGLDIRLCNAVSLVIEANMNMLSDKFNSKSGKNSHSHVDYQNNLLAGLRFNFGKGKSRKAAPAPVPVPVPVEEPKPAPVQEAKPEPVVEQPVVVEEPAPAPFEKREEVYFVINKWDITADEAAKLDALAADLKEHPEVSVKVTGYADVQTGTAQRNQFLSQKRAEAVASYLEAKGIEAGRISVDFKGSTEQPYGTPEKNRVAVCVVK